MTNIVVIFITIIVNNRCIGIQFYDCLLISYLLIICNDLNYYIIQKTFKGGCLLWIVLAFGQLFHPLSPS